jgi:hypothetical protein
MQQVTSADKLQAVEEQIRVLRSGHEREMILFCPFCGGISTPVALCCMTMHDAANAVLDRIEMQDRIDTLHRIQDKQ